MSSSGDTVKGSRFRWRREDQRRAGIADPRGCARQGAPASRGGGQGMRGDPGRRRTRRTREEAQRLDAARDARIAAHPPGARGVSSAGFHAHAPGVHPGGDHERPGGAVRHACRAAGWKGSSAGRLVAGRIRVHQAAPSSCVAARDEPEQAARRLVQPAFPGRDGRGGAAAHRRRRRRSGQGSRRARPRTGAGASAARSGS